MNEITSLLETYGDDVSVPLRNPKWRMIGFGFALAAFGTFPFFIDSDSPRAVLVKILCPLLIPIGAWIAYTGFRYLQLGDDLKLEIGWKGLRFPLASTEIDLDLEAIRKVWLHSANGQRTGLSFEHAEGKRALLPAVMLPPALESPVAEIVMRRAELRRAGVKSRSEMCAAEAYLAASRAGRRPMAVRVAKSSEGRHVPTLLFETSEVTRADGASDDETTFVPPAVLTTLREGGVEGKLKRLRGV